MEVAEQPEGDRASRKERQAGCLPKQQERPLWSKVSEFRPGLTSNSLTSTPWQPVEPRHLHPKPTRRKEGGVQITVMDGRLTILAALEKLSL
ncbi:unnamed protein product [Pleuronectes platessa]|uniref:Uncharacterized protein n=1 Tax=Pleuronectes platessa TaxID=8262 RepID=A0A9N7UME3_PLEPL|nr:unnamed protein product [Pleuronectes platessa]